MMLRRVRAEARYLLYALRVLARPLVGLALVCVVGATIHHTFGRAGGHAPTWDESFFVSYCLLFFEHIEQVPPHPMAQIVHYLQPLLGVVLVSEGILRLGLKLLDRQANQRIWIDIMAHTTHDHVILCGLGTVGFRIAEELRNMGIEVFAIERDDGGDFVEMARKIGVQVLIGDARLDREMERMNVTKARAMIIATDDDLANLEIAIDVRRTNADVPIVMRMFDQRLAEKVGDLLGIQVSVSTSRLAAPLFASSALNPGVVGTHRVGDRVMVVVEVQLDPSCSWIGKTIAEMGDADLFVVAYRPDGGDWHSPPRPSQALAARDRVHVMVQSDRVREIEGLAAG